MTERITMPPRREQLSSLLNDLQAELQQLDLWETLPPAPEAFESTTPFFADTTDFSQWLQWVFIARFLAILADAHPLPAQCDVDPLDEDSLPGPAKPTAPLTELLRRTAHHY